MEKTTPSTPSLDPNNVACMLEACLTGNVAVVKDLVAENSLYARLQDDASGKSPLMMAAQGGSLEVCSYLLKHGAPWNAVDRQGQCAGNYATNHEHWDVVNLLVDEGTKAELILGASMRLQKQSQQQDSSSEDQQDTTTTEQSSSRPVEHEPCTKPNYLRHALHMNTNGTALLDQDEDAVMMEWERPLMQAHAEMLMSNTNHKKRVLNIGFGMGIVDTILQTYSPSLHVIIEAHPQVYQRMLEEQWNEQPHVRICFGKWQDVLPQLIQEGVVVDGIFFDTYGEDWMDMEDFHTLIPAILCKPHGVYSFFNGLAPDNIFFHGVACQCVKLQLASLDLEAEFIPCEIQVPSDKQWEGVRRKYWHGRDTYYLPKVTWKKQQQDESKDNKNDDAECNDKKHAASLQHNDDATDKRQKTGKTTDT